MYEEINNTLVNSTQRAKTKMWNFKIFWTKQKYNLPDFVGYSRSSAEQMYN